MKLHPARPEKTTAKTKLTSKREQHSSGRAPQRAVITRSSSEAPAEKAVEPTPTAPTLLVPSPVFVRRDITGPDGSVRPGWEMWIGNHCFGRADSKELLLASFQRLQSPPESFHWREVRNRMQMRGRPKTVQPDEEKDEPWGWQKKQEEPLLAGEETAEGFQELTWETPA